MKKKVLLSSIVTIALCLALITGSTFALFTSEHEYSVAVTAGKVKLDAPITLNNVETIFDTNTMAPSYTHENTFENGGTATLVNNKLTLMYMTPGDAVNMTIADQSGKIANGSTVDIRYTVRLVAEGDLAPALKVIINGTTYSLANGSNDVVTDWTLVEPGTDIGKIDIKVFFPNSDDHAAQNVYQEKTADIYVQLIAVQANGAEGDNGTIGDKDIGEYVIPNPLNP